ncbi:hypothetical protein G7025_14565 [Pseudomonas lurida]|jgi:hypothetical protein|nr:hypothetical protein [Pseudomonas lurida]
MDNVFNFRDQLINEYSSFSRSFSRIQAADIREEVERQYASGRYWPEPLIQINPNYQRKGTVQQLAADGLLHKACAELFQVGTRRLRCSWKRSNQNFRPESLMTMRNPSPSS